jgi:hypothetical protein
MEEIKNILNFQFSVSGVITAVQSYNTVFPDSLFLPFSCIPHRRNILPSDTFLSSFLYNGLIAVEVAAINTSLTIAIIAITSHHITSDRIAATAINTGIVHYCHSSLAV